MRHIQYLSHEDRKGRKPGTRESRDVIAYLIKELKSYGIKPGIKKKAMVKIALLLSFIVQIYR